MVKKAIAKKIASGFKAKIDPVRDLKTAKAAGKIKPKPKPKPKPKSATKIVVPAASAAVLKGPSAVKKAGAAALGLGSATGAATLINRNKHQNLKVKLLMKHLKKLVLKVRELSLLITEKITQL